MTNGKIGGLIGTGIGLLALAAGTNFLLKTLKQYKKLEKTNYKNWRR